MSKTSNQSGAAKAYLLFYNALQFFGWLYVFILGIKFFTSNNSQKDFSKLWSQVEVPLTYFQTLQLIEVLHCIVRLVPSSPFTTFIQIYSRLLVVWGICKVVPECRTSIGMPLVVLSWGLAEITRYLYYALSLINAIPYILTWCRYTFFTFLYPSGVSGELLLMYAALPAITKRSIFTYPLPNFTNGSFHYNIFIVVSMVSYLPFFPQLYLYMVSQRKKVLGNREKSNKKLN